MVGFRTINVGFIPSGTAIVCRQALPASPLTAVLLIAFTTRLLAAWAWPNIYNPDETFQAVEQAHRLLYGYGVIPWEFQHGARSWVFPGLLAALMRVGAIIFGAQSGHTIGVTVGMSQVSLIPVWVGFAWGLRIGGLPAAVVAGAAPAIWFEAVYFGAKSSIETVAGSMLLLGVFQLIPQQEAMRFGSFLQVAPWDSR